VATTDENNSPEVADVLAEIAYAHAVRGLDSQVAVLAETRVRANYIVVATVAVATLFAGFLLRDAHSPSWLQVAALVPLAVLAFGIWRAVSVLCPTGKQGSKGKLELVASATEITKLVAPSAGAARRAVAEALEGLWDHNQAAIEGVLQKLRLASGALGVQVGCWVILLVLKQVL